MERGRSNQACSYPGTVFKRHVGCRIHVDFTAATGSQDARSQTDGPAYHIECLVLSDPRRVSLASSAEGLSALYHGADQFYAWRDSGLWSQIVAILVMSAREAGGRDAAPTAIVVDSQSVKTTEAGGPRGYDAAKKMKGRKRHLAVDTLGLPITCQITTADVQDRDALAPVLKAVHAKSPFVTMAFVDGGYNGDEAQRAAFEASRIAITVVKRTDKQIKGFIVLPKRWVVERTFGWINRARRLSKDFEATLESALAWLQIALVFLIMRRLAR